MSSSKRRAAKSAAIIAVFTLLSKFLGFIREVLIASKFGSGYETDTYFVAMTATVIVMSTVGAALNTTLIPIFTEIEEEKGKKHKLKYMNNVLNMVMIITAVLMVLGYFLSPVVIKILAKGFTGKQFQLAVKLNRIGLPIIFCLGGTYVFSGLLQSSERFGAPAIMGIPFNLVYIIFLLNFSQKFGIKGLMVTSVIAALTQVLVQIPSAKKLGYRYSFYLDLEDKYLNKALILTIPVLLGSAVQQINTIIDKTLASDLVDGSISALTYASRVNDLVISVFVMAITTVIFPMMTKEVTKDNKEEFKELMAQGINIILIITVPATIGLIILAHPAIKIFFEREAFDEIATYMTAQALIFYSIGLVGSSLRLMLNKVFYSFQDTTTPMINGAIAVGINVVLNLIFVKSMGHAGLAFATSISATFTTLLLFINLRKKMGTIGLRRYMKCFIKTLTASIIMGLFVYGVFYGLDKILPDIFIFELIDLIISVFIGIVVYFLVCCILKVEEVGIIVNRLGNRKKG
jgi:putative peptidoglycan lipid II flippase